jgi:hypothetical protein
MFLFYICYILGYFIIKYVYIQSQITRQIDEIGHICHINKSIYKQIVSFLNFYSSVKSDEIF